MLHRLVSLSPTSQLHDDAAAHAPEALTLALSSSAAVVGGGLGVRSRGGISSRRGLGGGGGGRQAGTTGRAKRSVTDRRLPAACQWHVPAGAASSTGLAFLRPVRHSTGSPYSKRIARAVPVHSWL